MSKYILAAGVAVAAACFCNTTAFAQENLGTAEQRAACTPDAFKLCMSYIPDPSKVEGCLRQNKTDLSAACRAVFELNTAQQKQDRVISQNRVLSRVTAKFGAETDVDEPSKAISTKQWRRDQTHEIGQ
jgi:hypothetical protein